ncbi:methylosome subunit pICln-like [Anneissia japonica]|uniref:methylosome subunit pICln-like n=1 Tax=Anneissia japonica TaxID=1529436 RepID=UPI001425BAD9|nr:methylosome subunit pICln-like [Anneissia japonica]
MSTLRSISVPQGGIVHTQQETDVYLKDLNKGPGTLYVTESCVLWRNEGGVGFQLEYPDISLHAISRDVSTFPHECVYLMINSPNQEPDDGLEDEDDEENTNDDSEISEIRFVPRDKESLMTIFHAMADCQALHPDEEDADSDDADPGFYEDADEVELNAEGQAVLSRLQFQPPSGGGDAQANGHVEEAMDTGQFDDADMES